MKTLSTPIKVIDYARREYLLIAVDTDTDKALVVNGVRFEIRGLSGLRMPEDEA